MSFLSFGTWTHSACEDCFQAVLPKLESAPTLKGQMWARVPDWMFESVQTCCRCGKEHSSSIIFRASPKNIKCQGRHK